MKVRDQAVHDLEIVRWENEQVAVAGAGPHMPAMVDRGFERAYDRRSHSPHPTPHTLLLVDGARGSLRDLVGLRVHRVLGEFLALDRFERAGSDVKIDPGDERALRLNAGEELGCEM